jgi:hypothetical protein
MAKGMQIAFNISLAIFAVTMTILVGAIFANVGFPDDTLNKPEYAQFGIAPIIKALKAIDVVDLYATLFSAFSSLITYVGKTIWK